MAATLSAAYHFKDAVDYEVGAEAVIAPDEAKLAITKAEHFVAEVKRVLASPPPAAPNA